MIANRPDGRHCRNRIIHTSTVIAPDDDGHKCVDNVILPEVGTDVADLGKECPGQAGESASKPEGQHIHPLRRDAHAGRHVPVLHDGANQEAERRLGKQEPGADDDQDREPDHEKPVIAQDHVGHGEVAAQPRGRVDLHVRGAEDEPEALLEDQRDAPGRQQ